MLTALRRIAEARGGIAKVAKAAGIERESLYRALSPRGNPRRPRENSISHPILGGGALQRCDNWIGLNAGLAAEDESGGCPTSRAFREVGRGIADANRCDLEVAMTK